jgi:hypothetical protein
MIGGSGLVLRRKLGGIEEFFLCSGHRALLSSSGPWWTTHALAPEKLPRAEHFLWRREQAFALHLLAGELALAADGFSLFARSLFRGLFISAARLHFAKYAFALQLLLQNPECLIDVVVSDENLQNYILHLATPGVATNWLSPFL